MNKNSSQKSKFRVGTLKTYTGLVHSMGKFLFSRDSSCDPIYYDGILRYRQILRHAFKERFEVNSYNKDVGVIDIPTRNIIISITSKITVLVNIAGVYSRNAILEF